MSAKKPDDEKISRIAPFGLRMLPDLKARIQEAADASGRSLNAEITARLEQSFERQTLDLSEAGLAAILKRMEASAEVLEALFMHQRDEVIEAHIQAEAKKGRQLTRREASREIFFK